jgi:hypothetical protein
MVALNAHVRNGRLVLDEPTTLPEGAEVRLRVVDRVTDVRVLPSNAAEITP